MSRAMNKILSRIREAGHVAALNLLQSLNAVAMAGIGGALIVHQAYPDMFRQLVSGLPPIVGAGALFLFGTLVHLAARHAKRAA
jgi:hypothetical protein